MSFKHFKFISNFKFKISNLLRVVIILAVLIGSALLFTQLTSQVKASWFSDSWGFRKKLTIDYTKVSGDQVYFPVLVSITDSSLSKAQADGDDILFTSSDGLTKLDHEIEKFDQSTNTLVAWVEIPTLSSSANTIIYMYYGNPSVTSQQNKTGVWDSDYVAVYHLNETSGLHYDSTNQNNSEYVSATQQGANIGKADGADELNGSSNYIRVPDSSSLLPSSDITVEGWAKIDTLASVMPEAEQILTKTTSANNSYSILVSHVDDKVRFLWNNSTPTAYYASYNTAVTTGNWMYLTGVHDGSTLRFYYDGSATGTTNGNPTGTIYNTNSSKLTIGSSSIANYTDGTIDEVRISKIARPAGWIATTYNTINSPSTFFSEGGEEKNRGPVLMFHFDEGYGTSTVADSSPGQNTGTLAGATKPSWQTEDLCVSGKCLYFNGSTSSVTVANTINNVQSVSFWVKPKTNGETLLDLDGGTHSLSATAGVISATGFSSPTIYVNGQASKTLTASVWQHITVTTATRFDANAIKIGNVSSTYFSGFIDEFKLYDYVRSSSQIKQDAIRSGSPAGAGAVLGNYSAGSGSTLNEDLVDYYKLDDNTGTTAADSSGNSNTGTLTNGPSWDTGKFSSGVSFDGSDDYVTAADSDSLDLSSDLSVSLWFSPTESFNANAGYVQGLLDKGSYKLFLDKSDGKLKAETADTSSSWSLSRKSFENYYGIRSLMVFNSKLYAGMYGGSDGYGDIFVCTPATAGDSTTCDNAADWTVSYDDDASTYNGVYSLAVFNDKLYAGMSYGSAGYGDIFVCNPATAGDSTTCDDPSDWTASYSDASTYYGAYSLTVFNSKLYASMYGGSAGDGDIFVCTPATAGDSTTCDNAADWTASYSDAATYSSVQSLTVFNDKLYAGMYRVSAGSGDIFVCTPATAGDSATCDDPSDWTASYSDASTYYGVRSLAVFNGKLYAGMLRSSAGGYGDIFVCTPATAGDSTTCDNASDWTTSRTDTSTYYGVTSLTVFNDKLYAGMYRPSDGYGDIFVCTPATAGDSATCDDPSDWTTSRTDTSTYHGVYSLTIFNSKLYAGMYHGTVINNGDIFVCTPATAGDSTTCDNASDWTASYSDAATYQGVQSLTVFNGKLYAGMHGGSDGYGDIFVCNPATAGDSTTCDNASDWTASYSDASTYWGAYSLTVFNGKLYAGMNSGSNGGSYIYVLAAGGSLSSTTSSWPVATWQLVTLTKSGTTLTLYINGSQQSTVTLASATLDTNALPLLVGKTYGSRFAGGSGENFTGSLDDIRIYSRALTSTEIQTLYTSDPANLSSETTPIARYEFDETFGTTAHDTSGNSNDLTLSAAGWTTSGKYASAYDGTDNRRLTRSDDADFDFAAGESFSLSLWFNRGGTISNTEYLLTKYNSNDGFQLYMDSDGDIVCGIGDGTSMPEDIAGTVSANYDDTNWHLATCVKSGTSSLRLYVDGKEVASDMSLAADGDMSNSGKLIIGDTDEADGTDEWLGDIDEVIIYRSALAADQVKLLYNQGQSAVLGSLSTDQNLAPSNSANDSYCPPGQGSTCVGPVGEWKFDENSGTGVNDSSENGYIGTWYGSSDHWKIGKFGTAGNFLTANSDYVNLGTTASLTPTSLVTAEAWVYPTRFPTQVSERMGILGRNYRQPWAILLWESGQVYWGYTMSNGTDLEYKAVGSPLTLNSWNLIAITHNVSSGQITAYINGVSTSHTAAYTGTLNTPSGTATIGSSGTTAQYFEGKIDQARIFNYVRTPAQIAWDYNQGAPIAHYRFDECSGETAHDTAPKSDLTTTGYNGTIYPGNAPNNHVGTCSSGDTFEMWNDGTTGKYSGSLGFDGTDDYVDLATSIYSPNASQDLTLSSWVNVGDLSATKYILATDDGSGPYYYLALTDAEKPEAFIYDSLCGTFASLAVTSDTAISQGTWHFITATLNRTTNLLSLYVDGNLVKTGNSSGVGDMSCALNHLEIGRKLNIYFEGLIDEVKIWNYALFPLQVKTLYNNSSAVAF